MPLSTIPSRLRKCWLGRHLLSPMPASTGGSPLDEHPKAPSLPTASLYSKTTLDESSANLPSKTFECSEEGWSNAQVRPEPSLAGTPTNGPRHSQGDGEKVAPKGHTLAVDELKERLARIVARTERSPKQPTRQQQSFTRARRNRIWSLIHGLLCHPRPDDTSDTCDRSLEDPASFRVAQDAPLVCGLARHPCPDGNSDTQDGSAEAFSFHLAQCLGIPGILVSPEATESDEVRAVELLLKTKRRRRQPVSFLLANYSGPLGRRNDPDIDDETDMDTDTAIGTDIGSDASIEDEINTGSYTNDDIDADETDTNGDPEDDIDGDGNLHPSLLEYLYRYCHDQKIEELMQAILVDQLVTKAPIDPQRDLEGLFSPGLQRYTRELAERTGKHLALHVVGVSTKSILDTALNQYQTWSHPLRSMEEPIILQQDLDQAKTALGECKQHHLGILSWLYLLRLSAQLDVLPDFHSFPASSRDIGKALTSVLQSFTITTTVNRVRLDRELLMACALRHRALIDARQRLGHSIDAKIRHVHLNLRARGPDLGKRWVIGETERLLPGPHAPSDLGDAERMERCRKTLKLQPFASLQARYPDVEVWCPHESAINLLQHDSHFQTDFVAQGQDRGVYLYYCTLALATYGFEPPLDEDIGLDYLLALILREMARRETVTLCLLN